MIIETSIGSYHVNKAVAEGGNHFNYGVKLYPISYKLNSLPMEFKDKTYINDEVIKEFSPTIRFTAVSVLQPHLIGIVDKHFIQICKHQFLSRINGQ